MDSQFLKWFELAQKTAKDMERISLDVFDTALLRTVQSPKDVFLILEKEFPSNEVPSIGFAEKRIKAEATARETLTNSKKTEITLEEIYQTLGNQYPEFTKINDLLISQELNIERKVSISNPWILALFKWAKDNDIEVDFISDIYLPKDFIVELLIKAGYESAPNHTWVSSEYGFSKHTKDLFLEYLKSCPCSPNKILHVGDNPHADIKQARKAGLNAFQINKSSPSDALSRNITESIFQGTLYAQNRIVDTKAKNAFYFKLGATVAGPLVVALTLWLKEQIDQLNPDVVFFLSREGKIIQEIFETIFPETIQKNKYLYASRRALNFSRIKSLDETALDFLTSSNALLQVKDFLSRIDIKPSHYEDLFPFGHFLNPEQEVTQEDKPLLEKLFKALEPQIIAAARNERNIYLEYLQNRIPSSSPTTVSIVDIGWNCSIQSSLKTLLNEILPETQLHGFYLGTFVKAKSFNLKKTTAYGYILQEGLPRSTYNTLTQCLEIVEILFSAEERSCNQIKKTADNKFEPVYSKLPNEPLPPKEVQSLQEGIRSYAQAFNEAIQVNPKTQQIPTSTAFAPLKRLLSNPTRREIEILGQLAFSDGFGDSQNFRKIVTIHPTSYNLSHPKAFLKSFKTCYWRTIFWKNLTYPEKKLLELLSPIGTKKVKTQLYETTKNE